MKNASLCIVLFALLYNTISCTTVYGQKKIEPQKIGDQCPDLEFNNIINFKTEKAKLSDFKGKLVILDFWATWCGPCILGMPKLDSLQKKFKDRIVVLGITSEQKDLVQKFFKTNQSVKGIQLASIVENRDLKSFFPHSYIPHQVWIDGRGKVIAITQSAEASEKNIELALNGKLDIQEKKDRVPDTKKAYLFGRFGDDYKVEFDKVKYQSMILDYNPNVGAVWGAFKVIDDKFFVSYTNVYLTSLYSYGFAESTKRMWQKPDFDLQVPNRTILEVRDSSMFAYWPGKASKEYTSEELKGKVYSFEMILPAKDSLNLKKYMIEDLNRYFGRVYGINGALEKREVTCWVLKRTGESDAFKTKHTKYNFKSNESEGWLHLENVPLRELVFWFTTRFFTNLSNPFIDETLYDGNIDIDLKTKLQDPISVSEALKDYGLEIVLEKRIIDMVVIKNVDK